MEDRATNTTTDFKVKYVGNKKCKRDETQSQCGNGCGSAVCYFADRPSSNFNYSGGGKDSSKCKFTIYRPGKYGCT